MRGRNVKNFHSQFWFFRTFVKNVNSSKLGNFLDLSYSNKNFNFSWIWKSEMNYILSYPLNIHILWYLLFMSVGCRWVDEAKTIFKLRFILRSFGFSHWFIFRIREGSTYHIRLNWCQVYKYINRLEFWKDTLTLLVVLQMQTY